MSSISHIYTKGNPVDDVLKGWRTRAVSIMLYVIAVVALPAYIMAMVHWVGWGNWLAIYLTSALYLLLILITIFRQLDYRVRASILLGEAFLMAIINLASGGLESSGRIFLLVIPIFALVLIGTRASWITTAVTALIYAVFFSLVYTGLSKDLNIIQRGSLEISLWISNLLTTMMLQIIVIALMIRLYRYLLDTLKTERKLSGELEQTYDKTLEGWARALELRDIETAGHCRRVSDITRRLAGKAGVMNGDMSDLHRGSLLHDIGKMGIADSILLKPGKLNDEEFKRMQEHTTYAHELLANIPYLLKALDIPYCHHEKWDGSGYPRGLKGTEIPVSARVFSVVDVYDALISDRPYRPAWTEEKALAYIKEKAGSEFDPAVVEAFIELANEEIESIDLEEPLQSGSN